MPEFCENCREYVEYTTSEKKEKQVLCGIECEYTMVIARCSECGEEIFVQDIVDDNLKRLYDVFNQKRAEKKQTLSEE